MSSNIACAIGLKYCRRNRPSHLEDEVLVTRRSETSTDACDKSRPSNMSHSGGTNSRLCVFVLVARVVRTAPQQQLEIVGSGRGCNRVIEMPFQSAFTYLIISGAFMTVGALIGGANWLYEGKRKRSIGLDDFSHRLESRDRMINQVWGKDK
jgi:hypothetical protein